MKMTDVDVREDKFIINIPYTKTKTSRKCVTEPMWIEGYLKMPSPDMASLFIGFRSGKLTRQNMEHNTISSSPSNITVYLKLFNV